MAKHPDPFSRWLKLSHDLAWSQVEAQQVIALRLMKLASGGTRAQREARRMVAEKLATSGEVFTTLAMGGSVGAAARRYRTVIRANRRRLGKPRSKG
jgi:hypothetical protein